MKWTAWVSDGSTVRSDPAGTHRRLNADDLPHLDFIEHVFIPDAQAKGCVSPAELALLENLLSTLRADAGAGTPQLPPPLVAGPAAAQPASTPPARTPSTGTHAPDDWRPWLPETTTPTATPSAPAPALVRAPAPAAPARAPAPAPAPLPTPPPREPSAMAQWTARTKASIGSDLAVHGLAYVGVLLFFVGAFGLVVFAFGDVAPTLRPVAELVIALAPFAAAALLLRRGATIVGRALEVVGGLLVPVMVITSFLDGNPVPPDLTGMTLAVTLTVLTSLVALAYAAWSARHPQSALRYLVAPVAWLAVGMATLGLGERDIPSGKAVATPSAAQTSAMLAALVVTVLLARARPAHRLCAPTRTAALPGLVVMSTMAALSGLAEGWPFGPVLVSGVLAVVALELLADRVPPVLVGLVEPMWWLMTWAALDVGAADLGLNATASTTTAVVAALAALGFLGILELAGAATRPALALVLPGAGIVTALLVTTTDAWTATVALGAASVWAAGRRMAPYGVRGAPLALDLATAILPVLALASLAAATSGPEALLTGSALVLCATVPARQHLLGRGADDRYWATWWTTGGATLLMVTTAFWLGSVVGGGGRTWLLVAGFGCLTLSAAVGPLTALWRPPVVTAVASLTWVCAAWVLDASALAVSAPLAAGALALVVAAHVRSPLTAQHPDRGSYADAASLGLSGHTLGLVAVALAVALASTLAVPGWAPAVAVGLATAGWGVTGWLDTSHRSPVASALARPVPAAAWMPLSLTAVGIPLTLVLTLDRLGLVPLDPAGSVYVVVATAVLYAVASRLTLPARATTVAEWGGFLVAAAAAIGASSAGSRPGTVAALAGVVVVTAVVRPERRSPVMTWVSWAVLAPLAGLYATEVWTWSWLQPAEAAAAWTLAVVGALLLVGAAAADLRGRHWEPRLLPQHPWALPPAGVGAGNLVFAVILATTTLEPERSGWVVVVAAAAALATALLSRAGIRVGVAVVLGWAGVLLLAAPELEVRPWLAALTALALLAVAQGLTAVSAEAPWWARWDTAVLVSAAPVAATGLVLASSTGSAVAVTFTAVGAECLAVAARLRREVVVAATLAVTGTVLVLVGAGAAGPGWLALALAVVAAACTALATRVHGPQQVLLQVTGALAAVAAWRLATESWAWSDQRAVDATALVAAGLVAAAAITAALTRIERSWVLVWGAAGVLVEAVCAVDVLSANGILRGPVEPSLLVTAGLAVVAVALAAAPLRLGLWWLRDLAVGYALMTLLVGMLTTDLGRTGQVLVLGIVSVATAVATLVLARWPVGWPWTRPAVELGAASTLWALALALSDTGHLDLLVVALAVSALQAAAVGVALTQPLLQMASPVLACAAWLVFAGDALDGNPQWVTVPIGLATLVVVALWRRERRAHGGDVAGPEIVVLELLGIAFLVGASLVQAVTVAPAYAALAAAIALAIGAWGLLTRVRRRVFTGAALLLVAVLLLVGVPLWGLLAPSWDAASLWVLIGLAGLAALVVAALLDWGKATARREIAHVAELTAGWE